MKIFAVLHASLTPSVLLNLGTGGPTKPDEFSEKFQRGGGGVISNPKIYIADFCHYKHFWKIGAAEIIPYIHFTCFCSRKCLLLLNIFKYNKTYCKSDSQAFLGQNLWVSSIAQKYISFSRDSCLLVEIVNDWP